MLSAARSCRSSICPGRLSTVWLVSLVVFSSNYCHNGLQVVTREVHQSYLWRLICPAQDHLIFLTLLVIYLWFFPLLDPDVGLSILVRPMWCWAYLFPFWSVRPRVCSALVWQVSAPYVIAGNTHELYAFLFRQKAILLLNYFGVWRMPPSLPWFFVVSRCLEAVLLSEVYVAFNIFCQYIIHVYWGVVYNHRICLGDVHLKTNSPTFIG